MLSKNERVVINKIEIIPVRADSYEEAVSRGELLKAIPRASSDIAYIIRLIPSQTILESSEPVCMNFLATKTCPDAYHKAMESLREVSSFYYFLNVEEPIVYQHISIQIQNLAPGTYCRDGQQGRWAHHGIFDEIRDALQIHSDFYIDLYNEKRVIPPRVANPSPLLNSLGSPNACQNPKHIERIQTPKSKLEACGVLGAKMIEQMDRLEKGITSFNPYWMNSSTKLQAITTALDKLSSSIDEAQLKRIIQDPNSELYQALNIQRWTPITFLGRLGWNNAKSLQNIHDSINMSIN